MQPPGIGSFAAGNATVGPSIVDRVSPMSSMVSMVGYSFSGSEASLPVALL